VHIHAIVDYSFLYYKYKFQVEGRKIKMLLSNGKDISIPYYSIREIEGFRRKLEQYGHQVTVSVCFDMPSKRAFDEHHKVNGIYKANRVKKLSHSDFDNINTIKQLLSSAGHNTYQMNGYEADDIIASLVRYFKDDFDYSVIYTSDTDLLMHVDKKVGVSRYKASKGYTNVDTNNFSDYLSEEYKCKIDYNSLMLYKSTVGDKSDNIPGIKGFGNRYFEKMIDHLNTIYNIDWANKATYENTVKLLELAKPLLNNEAINQALESLELVKPVFISDSLIEKPLKISTKELRAETYIPFNMPSLV